MTVTHTPVRPLHPPRDDTRATVELLARIGDTWTAFVIRALWPGPLRYNALHRAIDGISQRMLTRTLKHMEEDGLVERTLLPAVPAQVEYALTGLGRTLVVPLHGLHEWVHRHAPDIAQARKDFATKHA